MNRLTSKLLGMAASVALILALAPGSATAQMMDDGRPSVEIDLRGGLYAPTFDIADAADAGYGFGAGIGIPVGERLTVRGNADFGFHSGAEVDGVEGPDIDVYHYIAGLGAVLYRSPDGKVELSANAGGGAMTFSPDVEGADSFTYPAINVGATLAYEVAPSVSLLLSPQGDIAFSDEDEVGTDNSWVWPFTAGIRITPGG